MNSVFLDTVGLIAIWDDADQWHSPATIAYTALIQAKQSFVTTSCIFLECGNAAARKPFRNEVNALRRAMRSRGEVYEPTSNEIEEAWMHYDAGLAGDAGIVDMVSFLVMRRLGLRRAFTNDAHFRTAGFQTLF